VVLDDDGPASKRGRIEVIELSSSSDDDDDDNNAATPPGPSASSTHVRPSATAVRPVRAPTVRVSFQGQTAAGMFFPLFGRATTGTQLTARVRSAQW
jgi:hypothetical protein